MSRVVVVDWHVGDDDDKSVRDMTIAISDVILELSDRLPTSTEKPRSDLPRLQVQ
jgi:hypothetical protein